MLDFSLFDHWSLFNHLSRLITISFFDLIIPLPNLVSSQNLITFHRSDDQLHLPHSLINLLDIVISLVQLEGPSGSIAPHHIIGDHTLVGGTQKAREAAEELRLRQHHFRIGFEVDAHVVRNQPAKVLGPVHLWKWMLDQGMAACEIPWLRYSDKRYTPS